MDMIDRCPAEYHAHIGEECLGKIMRCAKEAGHDMRGWHRNPEDDASWNFDHRTQPPHMVSLRRVLGAWAEDGRPLYEVVEI